MSVDTQEELWRDEPELVRELVQVNRRTIFRRPNEAGKSIRRRGQHGKHHGLVEARFVIQDDIPPAYRKGIFATPQTFTCLIRFSSGDRWDDRDEDVHGMAIKLLDVPGDKLLTGEEASQEHDFLLCDHPNFFTTSLREYTFFNRHFTAMQAWRKNKTHFFSRLRAIAAFALNADLIKRAKAFAAQIMRSPLASHYWSTVPYLLGDKEGYSLVHYLARSAQPGDAKPKPVKSEDGIREALEEDLAAHATAFDFCICPQTNPVAQPIEDPTKRWCSGQDDACLVRLARIEIDQGAENQHARAESLVFTPWRALADHRPIGHINRSRLQIYQAMSALRLK